MDPYGELDFFVEPESDASAYPPGGRLHVGVPAHSGPVTLVVSYSFNTQASFFPGGGWLGQYTFTWPYYCGNLFPCRSNPAEGTTFSLNVQGVPAGSKAVYPSTIETEAPAYMLAIAVGDLVETPVGKTVSGTELSVWHRSAVSSTALSSMADFTKVFGFLEEKIGPYRFGPKAGAVLVDWGANAVGGMEHHPYWHVSEAVDRVVQAHEAAHGWYGDGVRIACWEDFVLSEGLATYLAARSLESVGFDAWPEYCALLQVVCYKNPVSGNEGNNAVALPDSTCNEIDIENHELWSAAPYYKGAFYLREVAELMGKEQLDQVLASFYMANVGGAARMQQLIDTIKSASPDNAAAIDSLTTKWLRTKACPPEATTLCSLGPI